MLAKLSGPAWTMIEAVRAKEAGLLTQVAALRVEMGLPERGSSGNRLPGRRSVGVEELGDREVVGGDLTPV
jgi:hypothetical protein